MYTHYEYYTQVFLLKPRVQFGMLRRNKNKNNRVSILPGESPQYKFTIFISLYTRFYETQKYVLYLLDNKTND